MISLEQIRCNNYKINRLAVKNILIVYFPAELYIGDSCCELGYISFFHAVFENSKIDIVYEREPYEALIKENPFINKSFFTHWKNISFHNYDLIITKLYDENEILNFLNDPSNYNEAFEKLSILSISRRFSMVIFENSAKEELFNNNPLFKNNNCSAIFDHILDNEEVVFFEKEKSIKRLNDAHEIYLSHSEITASTKWFNAEGVEENENIVVLLDESSSATKHMNTLSYIELVKSLATLRNIRILIFDPLDKKKVDFYKYVFSDSVFNKLIFARKTSLRESIGLLSDKRVKMILGPCTGLLHCASGVYNVFIKTNAIRAEDIPIMVTYTGSMNAFDIIAYREYHWWYDTLVHCVKIVSDEKGNVEIKSLSKEDKSDEVFIKGLLELKYYTGIDLFNFIKNFFYNKLLDFGLVENNN